MVYLAISLVFFFFEVAKLLNSGVYTIHKELVTLLQDESLEVIYFYWNFIMFNNSAIRQ